MNKRPVIIKSNGLGVDPWCNPTSTLKYWVNPHCVFTLVSVALFISWMVIMYASCMFFFLIALTKLGNVGHDQKLSQSQQIPHVYISFCLGTFLVILSVQGRTSQPIYQPVPSPDKRGGLASRASRL